jgi:hypothetical protein
MKKTMAIVINRGVLLCCISIIQLFACCSIMVSGQNANVPVKLKLAANEKGISEFYWQGIFGNSNLVDKNKTVGELELKYRDKLIATKDFIPEIIKTGNDNIELLFRLPENLILKEEFKYSNGGVYWNIELTNNDKQELTIQDLSFSLPLASVDQKSGLKAVENLSPHRSITGNSSFCYWIPFSGEGEILLMTMRDGTSLEYFTKNYQRFYIHSSTSVDRVNDTWRLPSTIGKIPSGATKKYGLKFQVVADADEVREKLYQEGGLEVRAVPGMTIPNNLTATCSFRCLDGIKGITAEHKNETRIRKVADKAGNFHIYEFSFTKLGENLVTVKYGNGKLAYLDFFVTEPLETLIKKRAAFITEKQQIRDTSKWYDGLYSIWNMRKSICLSPDNRDGLDAFIVGGSDDPSNSKPIYISEKNVVYPDQKEIAALEYYEKEFVWGGLQRTDKEYPYPYGIYGSENWHENRSGEIAGYNSGGWGKERMWRTFDYVTHIGTYFNLYLIARDHPSMVKYLDAAGYLERAYRTAIAYFEVPYNIKMGEKWSFHGWCDWAYKQGNFHERYILPLIAELEKNGEVEKAENLRREWEKKVKYMIYDDEWPFGSEMYVDRTAFESSYYIAEYAKENQMTPDEQLWYDKNKQVWYSHPTISDSATNVFMKKQLDGNLALRNFIEPGYNILGSAYTLWHYMDYMSQMGGAAILDYAVKFSNDPAKYINIGYNSMLSAFALMNTGENGIGYWFPDKENDGAAGWIFTGWQHDNWTKQRGPKDICGEVDHGFTGAVHSLATYVVNDPVFGLIAYGGKLLNTDKSYEIIPQDGVRRKLYFQNGKKFLLIEMHQDGFKKDTEIRISKDLSSISFSVENRTQKQHEFTFSLSGIEKGSYKYLSNGQEIGRFQVESEKSPLMIRISLDKENSQIQILKI